MYIWRELVFARLFIYLSENMVTSQNIRSSHVKSAAGLLASVVCLNIFSSAFSLSSALSRLLLIVAAEVAVLVVGVVVIHAGPV